MTIKFCLDGFKVHDTDIGDEGFRRGWYLFAPTGTVTEFAQPGANNLQQALVAAHKLLDVDTSADIWLSTDDKPPAAGWPQAITPRVHG